MKTGAGFILALLLCAGLTPGLRSEAASMRIGVSIFPLKMLAERIAGPRASVFFAVPAGANPHVFEPTPSLVRQMQSAELFIGISPGFDGWAARFLARSARHVYLHDGGGDDNPHIWLSPRLARKIVARISAEFGRLRPQFAAEFTENLRLADAELEALDSEIGRQFAFLPCRRFILWHPSWNWFAADFGLEIAGCIESGHGDEPTVRDFQKLAAKARSERARVVVLDLNVQSSAARALVREIGGVLLRLDALGDPADPERSTYLGLMRWNASRLAKALADGCR